VAATVPAPPPVAPLRTPATPTGAEAFRQIREIIESTQKLLDKAEQQQLSDDRKANLTQARGYLQQAEEAIKKEDWTLARSLAERAQNIGKLLTSR
jgi:phage shock protein A